MPDLFYDLFIKEFESIRNKIENSISKDNSGMLRKITSRHEFKDIWKKINSIKELNDIAVAAIDGGIRTLKFSDGTEIIITRAISVNNLGYRPIRTVKTKYLPVPSNIATWITLLNSEIEAAFETIFQIFSRIENQEKYILFDGSLYVRITGLIHELMLTRGFLDLYYIPEIIETLGKLSQLLNLCKKHNVNIIFISKTSGLKLFKDHLVFTMLRDIVKENLPFLKLNNDIIDLLTKGIEWYSIVWLRTYRKKLVELIRNYEGPESELVKQGIKLVLCQSITDVNILDQLAHLLNIDKGISRRLLVGVIDAYLNARNLVNVESLVKMIKDRLEDSLILRSVEERFENSISEYLSFIKSGLETLPRILVMYVKFSKNDSPILIEIPVFKWYFFDDKIPPKLFYDTYDIWDIIYLLNSLYKGPYHYNKLLWLAHEYVTFTDNQFDEYVAYTIKCLRNFKGKRILSLITSSS